MQNAPVPANAKAVPFATTRRIFLGAIASAVAPAATLATTLHPKAPAVAKQPTNAERLEAAVIELVAAMTAIHGDGVQLVRNGEKGVCVFEPHRPHLVEFQGAGIYEIKHEGRRPFYLVERAPKHDCPMEGRCFRLSSVYGRRDVFYYYEHHLRTVLIRKTDRVLNNSI